MVAKWDRKALPDPDLQETVSQQQSPENKSTLYSLWAETLGHSNFRGSDNFFDIWWNISFNFSSSIKIDKAFNLTVRLTDFFNTLQSNHLNQTLLRASHP